MVNKLCDFIPSMCSAANSIHPAIPVVAAVATAAAIAKKCLTSPQSDGNTEPMNGRASRILGASFSKMTAVAMIVMLASASFLPVLVLATGNSGRGTTGLQAGGKLPVQGVCSEYGENCGVNQAVTQQAGTLPGTRADTLPLALSEMPVIRSYGDFRDLDTKKAVKCMVAGLPEGQLVYANSLGPVVEKMLRSESARALLAKALAKGPIFILPGDSETAPQGGSWWVHQRIIRLLSSESSDRKLGHLLFEMSNSLHSEEQLKLGDEVTAGAVSKSSYVKRFERLEYEASKEFTATIRACIGKDKWSKATDLDIPWLMEIAPDWERFWNLASKSSHAEQFRKDWTIRLKDRYCGKHPESLDCR